jgi:hypothetical protein
MGLGLSAHGVPLHALGIVGVICSHLPPFAFYFSPPPQAHAHIGEKRLFPACSQRQKSHPDTKKLGEDIAERLDLSFE